MHVHLDECIARDVPQADEQPAGDRPDLRLGLGLFVALHQRVRTAEARAPQQGPHLFDECLGREPDVDVAALVPVPDGSDQLQEAELALLLVVLDALSIAGDPALKSLMDGVEVTERELVNMLERHGIRRIDPKGERFDPNFHQAMLEIENKDLDAGTVAEVVQPGYVIEERVLRPAMVAVSKGGPKRPKPEEPAETPRAANDDEPPAKPTRP